MSAPSPRWRVVAALVLLLFGLVELLRFLPLAVGPSDYAMLVHGVLALLACAAGAALWLGSPRAPAVILALGCTFAATRLVDALVLGIRPWLFALLSAIAALVAAVVLAGFARAEPRPS